MVINGIRLQLSAAVCPCGPGPHQVEFRHLRAIAMVSQYPAELPGSTAAVLHRDVNKLDVESEHTFVAAPVAAVTNVDALALDTVPGMPKLSGKQEKTKKPKEKGVSYFSLYRQVALCV